jgi:hypothetical protein
MHYSVQGLQQLAGGWCLARNNYKLILLPSVNDVGVSVLSGYKPHFYDPKTIFCSVIDHGCARR